LISLGCSGGGKDLKKKVIANQILWEGKKTYERRTPLLTKVSKELADARQ